MKRERQQATDEAELKFRAALAEESDFPLSDELYDYITAHAEARNYTKGEAIVEEGVVDPDIYIVKEGVIRGYMTHEGTETNIYFGMEGTVLASMQGFSLGQAAIIRFEACCKVTMLRITKSDFDRMMESQGDERRCPLAVRVAGEMPSGAFRQCAAEGYRVVSENDGSACEQDSQKYSKGKENLTKLKIFRF